MRDDPVDGGKGYDAEYDAEVLLTLNGDKDLDDIWLASAKRPRRIALFVEPSPFTCAHALALLP